MCKDNCDAKACSASSSSECDANLVDMTKERDALKLELTNVKKNLAIKERELATSEALLRNGAAEVATAKSKAAELASAKSKETELVGRAQRAEAMIIHLKANLAATQTEQLKTKETELATAKSELATKETKLTTCTSSLILIQREHRDAHQMRVRMTNERDTARSEAARAKRELVAMTSERDAAKRELVAMTSELATAKECKAKSPNYKAPVNDECNPKNCDEWDCGQWCVCYNADHDATYEALGCAADDEDMCQCD
jgi:chromosome segregation ATPase